MVIDAAQRAPDHARSVRSAWILLGLAGASRVALLFRGAGASYDEARIGVGGLALFHGEFPVYFAGQSFMGTAADVYLAGLAYVLLGAAPVTLELVGILLSVAWVALVVRLTLEAWGPRAAGYAALWLALPPDLVLWWAQESRPHYHLTLTLGILALLLARRIPGAPPATAARRLLVLGLVTGLGYWTNPLSIVYLPAVILRLVLDRYRPRRLAEIILPSLAFGLGALPHLLYTLPRGSAVPSFEVGAGLHGILAHLLGLARAWPVLLGVPAGLPPKAVFVLAALLTVLYVGLIAVARRPRRQDAFRGYTDLAALSLVIAANLGAVVVARYGDLLWPRAFYLAPVWTALPALAAAGLAALPGRRVALGVAGLLITIHAAGIVQGLLRGEPPLPDPILRELAPLAVQRDVAQALARDGTVRLYESVHGRRDLTFVSRERVILSHHYEEALPRYARAVDGAPAATVGWWVDRPRSALEQSLAALGAGFEYRAYPPLGGAYARFAVPPLPLRELDPDALRVTASESGARAAWALDRDAATAWRTAGPMRGGEWIEVDLGAARPVAMVRWLPRVYEESPVGFTLEAAIDRTAWRRLLEAPNYLGPLYWSAGRPMSRVRSGRVELRITPTLARYLRITQTGPGTRWPWSISELFVYVLEPTAPSQPAPWRSGVEIAAALRQAGIRWLYADHGWGSTVALADPTVKVLPANLHLDSYGWDGPRAALVPPVVWEPGRGALLEPIDAEGFVRVAAALGRPVVRESLGELVLLRAAPPIPATGRPLAQTELDLTASIRPERAGLALDGDRQTRWATGRPQAPGDWLRIDLRAATLVRAVRVWTRTPLDWPRGVTLEGSTDGTGWQPLATRISTEGGLRWGGIALLRDGVDAVRLDFAPTVLRALRLVLTRGDPVYDWSVHELTVYTN